MTTAVKERAILFSAPMVRAILDGRKTVTRRVVKGINPEYMAAHCDKGRPDWQVNREALASGELEPPLRCPYGQPGDRLWVRESFDIESFGAGVAQIRYKADGKRGNNAGVSDRKLPDRIGGVPSIHMPRHCSRITLEVEAVRVERLQEITSEQAFAEGFEDHVRGHVWQFRELWHKLNGPESWNANPWVWVVQFRRVEL